METLLGSALPCCFMSQYVFHQEAENRRNAWRRQRTETHTCTNTQGNLYTHKSHCPLSNFPCHSLMASMLFPALKPELKAPLLHEETHKNTHIIITRVCRETCMRQCQNMYVANTNTHCAPQQTTRQPNCSLAGVFSLTYTHVDTHTQTLKNGP